jgi:hypothetical protein
VTLCVAETKTVAQKIASFSFKHKKRLTHDILLLICDCVSTHVQRAHVPTAFFFSACISSILFKRSFFALSSAFWASFSRFSRA